jgi:hypothetical protein
MGQRPHQDLLLLVDPLAGPQPRARETLLPPEPALDPPPLAGDATALGPTRRAAGPPHRLSPVPRPGPPPARVPPVRREGRRADTPTLTGQGGVVLGVGGAVTRQRLHRAAAAGGPHRRRGRRRVLTRAAGDVRRKGPVAPGLQDGRQLGPGTSPPRVGLLGPPGEGAADVPGLRPGGVDGRPGPGGDQAACPRRDDGRPAEGIGPLSSSRRSAAFWVVGWSGTSSGPGTARHSARSWGIASRPR